MPTIASIPAPPLRNIEIGSLQLHMYGLLIGIGIVLAIALVERIFRWNGLDDSRLLDVLVPSVLAGFVGARLYHVASQPVHYANNPAEIIKVWNGGLGIYGGVLLGTITGVLLARRWGVQLPMLFDAVAVALPLAQAIGRWGNYFNQELFGGPSTLPWALRVDEAYRPPAYLGEATFHPTFLYESLGDLAICALVLVLVRRWNGRAPGVLFPIYLACYSLLRFFVEGMRVDHANVFLGLRQNEWVAATLFVCAATVAIVMHVRRARQPVS